MSITTRAGDKGRTRLFSGEAVDKCSARPDAYGDLDELVSALGLARLHCRRAENQEALLALQRELFVAGSELATSPEGLERLTSRIDASHLAALDVRRDALEATIELPRQFIIPGGSLGGAHLDVARTVARRLERKVVRLHLDGALNNEYLLQWLNRLSDYLWLMARSEEDKPTLLKD